MKIQESAENYLETILMLEQSKGRVRSIDIAVELGFSKPSVSRALGLLKQGGYVVSDSDGFLFLTKEGRHVAEKTYERHRMLTEFFVRLGVDEKIAVEDACKIEHHISDETFEALKRHAQKYSGEIE